MSQTEHNESNVNEPTKRFVKILIDQIIKNNAADDSIFYYPKTYFGGIPDVNIHYTKGIIRVTPSSQFKYEWETVYCNKCKSCIMNHGYSPRYRIAECLKETMVILQETHSCKCPEGNKFSSLSCIFDTTNRFSNIPEYVKLVRNIQLFIYII